MVGCLHLQIFMDIKALEYLQVLSVTLFLCFLSYMTEALAVYSYMFIGHVITLCGEVIICIYSAFVYICGDL